MVNVLNSLYFEGLACYILNYMYSFDNVDICSGDLVHILKEILSKFLYEYVIVKVG